MDSFRFHRFQGITGYPFDLFKLLQPEFIPIFTYIKEWITKAIDLYKEMTPRTIQMTLDDDLVEAVDNISKVLQTNRSAFTRMALRDAINKYNLEQLERKHREGYARHPVKDDEFAAWEDEQAWGGE